MEKKVVFENGRGLKLAGVLLLPTMKNPPVVVFAHGFGSSKESPRNRPIADELVRQGIAVLLFDFTGHGESEGAQDDATTDVMVDDLSCAVGYVKTIPVDSSRLGVAGSSSGGTVALILASRDNRIKVLALRVPPAEGLEGVAEKIKIPTLIVEGEFDPWLKLSEGFVKHIKGEKRLVVVKGANHLFEQPEQMEEAKKAEVRWLVEWLHGNGR